MIALGSTQPQTHRLYRVQKSFKVPHPFPHRLCGVRNCASDDVPLTLGCGGAVREHCRILTLGVPPSSVHRWTDAQALSQRGTGAMGMLFTSQLVDSL